MAHLPQPSWRVGLYAAWYYTNGTLTLFDAQGHAVDTLAFAGHYKTADFALQREGQATHVVYAGSNAYDPYF